METQTAPIAGLPRINEPAPDFKALTTAGEKGIRLWR